mgnify:CR=1 FL=1
MAARRSAVALAARLDHREPLMLPAVAYSVEQARELDRLASASFDVPAFELMQRAGRAAFQIVRERYALAQQIVVICGKGNNGGDGYVLARLLREARREVRVLAVGAEPPESATARAAFEAFRAHGGVLEDALSPWGEPDLIVDALFGIGLNRAPDGAAQELIARMNAAAAPVFALDVPSGLNADTGHAPGAAVHADCTLSFIVLKRGLLTGAARAHVGQLLLHDLDLPKVLFACLPAMVDVLRPELIGRRLRPRARDAHKGHFGHVLVVGGDHGMGGAVRLAAEAALRSGAGLVSVGTRSEHVGALLSARPEAMVRGISGPGDLEVLLERADVVVVGPGLGQSTWSHTLLTAVAERDLPTVMDADALNLLAQSACVLPERVVLTPHPGEAARLLECSTQDILVDRYGSAERLAECFQAVVVLKGAGSLVSARGQRSGVCLGGNPGMASGGSGDVLAGVLGALIGQGLDPFDAACVAVTAHAQAGDLAAAAIGERGMLAGDLLSLLPRCLN